MVCAQCERLDRTADWNISPCSRSLVVSEGNRASVAELAEVVGAPAANRAILEACAVVVPPALDLHDATRTKVDRADRAGEFIVADRENVSESKLPAGGSLRQRAS